MSEFTWTPSYGSSVKRKPSIHKAQFGDGYAQRTQNGINANPKSRNLVFSNLTAAVADAIEAFLEGKNGSTPFTFTFPGESEQMVVCEQWDRMYNAYNQVTITATFEQDFAPV